ITTVAGSGNVVISASYSGATKTATLVVQAVVLVSLTLNPTSVNRGNEESTGTVALSGLAPAGAAVVTLTGGRPEGTFWVDGDEVGRVTVAAGSRTADFKIHTTHDFPLDPITGSTVITASYGGENKIATLEVRAIP